MPLDPSLRRIAERHAAEILRDERLAGRARVNALLRAEGIADALVYPFAVVGADAQALERAAADFVEGRGDLGWTHLGRGAASAGGRRALVLIGARRLIALAPLPRRLPSAGLDVRGRAGAKLELRALQAAGGPCRQVRELPIARRGDRLLVRLPPDPADSVFEILAYGPRGPEVAALWRFGQPGPRPAAPADPAALLAAIAAERAACELGPLGEEPALALAARRHAEEVCRTRVPAHVSADGRTPLARARAAGFDGSVLENIALAPALGEAHQQILESPSHLANVLDPLAHTLGLGVVVAADGTRCLVELFGGPREAPQR